MAKVKSSVKAAETKRKTTAAKKKGDDYRDKISELLKTIDSSWYDLSLILNDVYKMEIYKTWGYSDFKEYVEKELPLDYRSVMYRVELGGIIREKGLKKEVLDNIGGWTKLQKISRLLKEADNEETEKLLETAKEKSVRELDEFVKEVRNELIANGKETEKVKKTTLKFRFTDEQADLVEDAIKVAMEMADTDNKSLALEYICSEWLVSIDTSDNAVKPKKEENVVKEEIEEEIEI